MNMRNNDDKKISVAIMAPFVILTIQYFILVYFNIKETSDGSSIQMLSKILVGLSFIYALPTVLKRSKIKLLAVYVVSVFIIVFYYFSFQENQLYLGDLLFPFFFICLPMFIYSLSIQNWRELRTVMKKASYIVFIFGTIIGALISLGISSGAGTYSMSLSYYMLLPTIMFMDDIFNEFSLITLFFIIISLSVILVLGSRGAILCIFVFSLLKSIRPGTRLSNNRKVAYLFLFGVSLFGYIFLNEIFEFMNSILLSFDIRSRNISLFLNNEDLHLSGRDILYKNIIEEIINNPLLGIGLAGDRRALEGSYAHNIFLELLANYGVFLGIIISFLLVIIILRCLILKDGSKYNMIIIWLCLGFIPLMFSGSYLTEMKFWTLLGLMLKNCITMKSPLH